MPLIWTPKFDVFQVLIDYLWWYLGCAFHQRILGSHDLTYLKWPYSCNPLTPPNWESQVATWWPPGNQFRISAQSLASKDASMTCLLICKIITWTVCENHHRHYAQIYCYISHMLGMESVQFWSIEIFKNQNKLSSWKAYLSSTILCLAVERFWFWFFFAFFSPVVLSLQLTHILGVCCVWKQFCKVSMLHEAMNTMEIFVLVRFLLCCQLHIIYSDTSDSRL